MNSDKARPAAAGKTGGSASRPRLILNPSGKKNNKRKAAAKDSTTHTQPVGEVRPLPAVVIPPLLFEGDAPTPAGAGGPGEKFVLEPRPAAPTQEKEHSVSPPMQGTGSLWLAAREPHSLYAGWDVTAGAQQQATGPGPGSHWAVRVYQPPGNERPIGEIQVLPQSQHSFIPVQQAGTTYAATLGYYLPDGQWLTLATSAPAQTPPDAPSPDKTFRFAAPATQPPPPAIPNLPTPSRVPPALPEPELPPPVPPLFHADAGSLLPPETRAEAARSKTPRPTSVSMPSSPVAGVANRATPPPVTADPRSLSDQPGRRVDVFFAPPNWTPEQEQALAELIGQPQFKQGLGSLEIVELLGLPRAGGAPPGAPAPSGPPGLPIAISSPGGGEGPTERKGFWFNVNAELVVYGATDPNASVTIGGRPIRLRADGTFSYRFALPDGSYVLPVAAVSPEHDTRQAELGFSRWTLYYGEVGSHAQDPALRPPSAEGLA